MLMRDVAMTQPSFTHTMTIVLAMPAVLSLICIVEITGGICTAFESTMITPMALVTPHLEVVDSGRKDAFIVVTGRGHHMLTHAKIQVAITKTVAFSWAPSVVESPCVTVVLRWKRISCRFRDVC